MRVLVSLLLLPLALALAQDETGPATCNVVSQPVDVSAEGQLVRPPPTAEECELAATLEEKFLATSPRNFRLVRNLSRLPEPVRIYVEGLDGSRAVRNPVNVQVGRWPQQQWLSSAIWLGSELVVIAYRTSEIAGSSTNIVLADTASLTVCTYMRWRGGALPSSLSIAEIQRALDKGLLGNRETPTCRLGQLPLD